MPKCDCSKVPFKPDPPCFSICAGNLLALASKEQLVEILGLDAGLADRILLHAHGRSIRSLSDFEPILGADMEAVTLKIREVTHDKLIRFHSQRQNFKKQALE